MSRAPVVLALLTAGAIGGCGGASAPSASSSTTSTTSTGAQITSAPSSASTSTPAQPTSTSTPATSSTTTTSSPTTPTSTASSTTTTPSGGAAPVPSTFTLTSSAFASGAPIPKSFTCQGSDISPPLHWSGAPANTRELVLIMRDPDAPGGDFIHWAVAGISPAVSGFSAGGVSGLVTPGRNSFGTLGYRGPCPPVGAGEHHYVISLSALGARSGLAAGFSANQVPTGALGVATLTGRFGR